MKKVWLRALNAAIGKMVEARKGVLRQDVEVEEGDEETQGEVEAAMLQALEAGGGGSRGKEERSGRKKSKGAEERERRSSQQKIDVPGLRRYIEKEGVRSANGVRAVWVLQASKDGTLEQMYERVKGEKGRWYATGRAQLQSVSKGVRRAAVGALDWECDLVSAYPTILLNLLPQDRGRWGALREYVRDKTVLKDEVAEGFGVTRGDAKRLLLSVIFGRSIERWRRGRPDVVGPTPQKLRRFATEVAQAREMLTKGRRKKGESQLTALSRRVQEAERRLMDTVEAALAKRGYETGTLVHDALIVQREDGRVVTSEDKAAIQGIVSVAMAEFGCVEGWHTQVKMSVRRVGE